MSTEIYLSEEYYLLFTAEPMFTWFTIQRKNFPIWSIFQKLKIQKSL